MLKGSKYFWIQLNFRFLVDNWYDQISIFIVKPYTFTEGTLVWYNGNFVGNININPDIKFIVSP